ncbi:MAG: hypothetical protein NC185_10885, partial [Ruminococcus sp.]|nr:hypothetical protein [Ruminococcus sp.]
MSKKNIGKKQKIAIAAVLVLFIAIIAAVASGNRKSNDYSKTIELICSDEYSSAAEMITGFDSDYKEIGGISQFISLHDEYYQADEEDYENILSKANQMNDFQDESLMSVYQDFEKELSSNVYKYNNKLLKAAEIDALIEKIDLKKLTINDKDKVANIREAYDSTPSEVQQYVKNPEIIGYAEDKLKEIQNNIDEAKKLDDMISDLGTVTLKSKDDLKKIEDTYKGLSAEAKTYVENYSDFTSAKKAYNKLVEEENEKRTASTSAARTSTTASASHHQESQNNYNTGGSTVYWVSSGKVYHNSPNCPSLSRSRNIMSGSISQS